MTDFISEDYPNHNSWFYKKHLHKIITPVDTEYRDIIYAEENGKPLGVSFTKADEVEKNGAKTALIVISVVVVIVLIGFVLFKRFIKKRMWIFAF